MVAEAALAAVAVQVLVAAMAVVLVLALAPEEVLAAVAFEELHYTERKA